MLWPMYVGCYPCTWAEGDFGFYFQKQIFAHLKSYIFHFNTSQVNLISDWALNQPQTPNQPWALEFEHHWGTRACVVRGTKCSVFKGHTLEGCIPLRLWIQDLIDNKLIQFENTLGLDVITNPLPPHPERNVNAISIVEERIIDFSSPSFPWKDMLWVLAQKSHIALENIRALGFDWEVCSFCNSQNRHALFDCGLVRALVQGLADHGIIWIKREVVQKGDCMATSLCPLGLQAGTSHGAMSMGSRINQDEYLLDRVCKIPLGIGTSGPPISCFIEEIVEQSLDSEVSALKKEQAISAIQGFALLILSLLLEIAKSSPGFVQKETHSVPTIHGFTPIVLRKSVQVSSRAPSLKALKASGPSIISPKTFSLAPNLQTQEGLIIHMPMPFPYKDDENARGNMM